MSDRDAASDRFDRGRGLDTAASLPTRPPDIQGLDTAASLPTRPPGLDAGAGSRSRISHSNAGKTTRHEVREMQSATVGAYTVSVLQVLPAPTSSQRIAAADYRATLKITR